MVDRNGSTILDSPPSIFLRYGGDVVANDNRNGGRPYYRKMYGKRLSSITSTKRYQHESNPLYSPLGRTSIGDENTTALPSLFQTSTSPRNAFDYNAHTPRSAQNQDFISPLPKLRTPEGYSPDLLAFGTPPSLPNDSNTVLWRPQKEEIPSTSSLVPLQNSRCLQKQEQNFGGISSSPLIAVARYRDSPHQKRVNQRYSLQYDSSDSDTGDLKSYGNSQGQGSTASASTNFHGYAPATHTLKLAKKLKRQYVNGLTNSTNSICATRKGTTG